MVSVRHVFYESARHTVHVPSEARWRLHAQLLLRLLSAISLGKVHAAVAVAVGTTLRDVIIIVVVIDCAGTAEKRSGRRLGYATTTEIGGEVVALLVVVLLLLVMVLLMLVLVVCVAVMAVVSRVLSDVVDCVGLLHAAAAVDRLQRVECADVAVSGLKRRGLGRE